MFSRRFYRFSPLAWIHGESSGKAANIREDGRGRQDPRMRWCCRRQSGQHASYPPDMMTPPTTTTTEVTSTDRFGLGHGYLGGVHENGGVVVRPLQAASRNRDQSLIRVVVKSHIDSFFAPPEKPRPLDRQKKVAMFFKCQSVLGSTWHRFQWSSLLDFALVKDLLHE